MDPDVTLAIMRDTTATYDERMAAAINLTDWLLRGGFPPDGMTAGDAFVEAERDFPYEIRKPR